MTNLSDAVRPCPFCDCASLRVVDVERAAWAVACTHCYARGPQSVRSAALAIAAWNARATPSPSATESV